MLQTTSRHSRTFHLLVAVLSVAGFLALVHLLPSIARASDTQILIQAVVEIGASVLLLYGVIRWAGQPREFLGVRRLRVSALAWGGGCFVATAILSHLVAYAVAPFGIGQQKETLAALASHPIPIILLLAAMGAIAEEIIFRSVLISQLEAATSRPWLAGLLSVSVFTCAHASGWGPSQIIFAAVPGLVWTLFFLWKRNLWICMIAHFLMDALGLLAAAAYLAPHS